MRKAIWNGAVIADSDETVVVEGNHYFPKESVDEQYLSPSEQSSVCHWKGTASYYDIVVGSEVNKDAAFFYREPKEAASQIADRIAFWKGVEVG
jgi:uncharacterized protein (DUF427 family)